MNTKKVATVGVLSALMIVFTLLSNYIVIGTISINLALIVIVAAAIKFDKQTAFLVGLINGIVVMLSPSTAAFFSISIVGTILVCSLKTGLAGLVCGYVYEALNKKNHRLAVGVSSALVPITNTGIFIIGSVIFFSGSFGSLITIFVTLNFVIELISTVVLSLAISYFLK